MSLARTGMRVPARKWSSALLPRWPLTESPISFEWSAIVKLGVQRVSRSRRGSSAPQLAVCVEVQGERRAFGGDWISSQPSVAARIDSSVRPPRIPYFAKMSER